MKTLMPAAPAAEPEFLLAVQRAVRTGRDSMAILVHLSRLREARATLPPPHQLHVARSILQEAAQRFEGQVFSLRNGDLALLCRAQLSRGTGPARAADAADAGTRNAWQPGPRGGGAAAFEPTALPAILARLFHADMARLISVWPLATEGEALLGYAADRLAEAPVRTIATPTWPPVSSGQPARPARPAAGFGSGTGFISGTGPGPAAEPAAIAVVDGIAALLAGTRVAELMHRQTAIRLLPRDGHDDDDDDDDDDHDHGHDDGHDDDGHDDNGHDDNGHDDNGHDRGSHDQDGHDRGDPPDGHRRHPGEAAPPRHRLQAAFRELTFSIAALESRVASIGGRGMARTDPFLFRHLAGRLDVRMLTLLLAEAGSGELLDFTTAAPDNAAWHINLTLPAILSEAFGRLIDLRRDGGFGVEIAYAEAVADPAGFARVRKILAAAEINLVLDGIDDMALRLTRPWRLGPDLLKLDWSQRLTIEAQDGGDMIGEAIAGALDRMGAGTVVLQKADTAEALGWGLAHGIELFQGHAVDALLGERRMSGCRLAPGCTARQCIDRAAAVGTAGRSGCGNTYRLDDTAEAAVELGAAVHDAAWRARPRESGTWSDDGLPAGAPV